jgi:hypothetical protein
MTMFPICIPFPSSGDKENIPVTRNKMRARCNALIGGQSASHPTATLRVRLMTRPNTTGTKSSRRPLLQRVISRDQSPPRSPITILTNPARARSSPSVLQSRSPPQITIVSDLEKEKREAHPLSPPKPKSILLKAAETCSSPSIRTIHWSSPSPLHITILSNPNKEKREAHPRSTQRTKSIENALSEALALKRAPAISITPISILKAPTPPQTPPQAPAPAVDPNPDAVKENVKVKFLLSDIVEEETGEGVCDPETGTGADTTMKSSGEMLGVPLVDWRGRLDEDELARYYPKEHAKEQFAQRLRSMVRSGNRSAAARRRDRARRRGQAATTTTATATPPPIAPPSSSATHPHRVLLPFPLPLPQ